jgi:hypothetical protein
MKWEAKETDEATSDSDTDLQILQTYRKSVNFFVLLSLLLYTTDSPYFKSHTFCMFMIHTSL